MSHTTVDLVFPLLGDREIPTDHSYSLYAAMSQQDRFAQLHEAEDVGVFPIANLERTGNGRARLGPRSRLRLRLSTERLSAAIALAGKSITLDGTRLRVGVPRVLSLRPTASLRSGLVFIKLAHTSGGDITPQRFLEAAQSKLTAPFDPGRGQLGLSPSVRVSIPTARIGPHVGQPLRRIRRVKGRTLVGYPLVVECLTAEESLVLQEQGLGGKRKMGCGLFLPVTAESTPRDEGGSYD